MKQFSKGETAWAVTTPYPDSIVVTKVSVLHPADAFGLYTVCDEKSGKWLEVFCAALHDTMQSAYTEAKQRALAKAKRWNEIAVVFGATQSPPEHDAVTPLLPS